MRSLTDPHPDPRYATIRDHFAAVSSYQAKLAILEQALEYAASNSILEIGTAYGLSAIAMGLARPGADLVTIEFFEPQATLGPANIRSAGIPAECIIEDKLQALPRLASERRKFDFVFHDGGHTGDSYVSDFETIYPMLLPDSIYVIDDIAWDDLTSNREITRPLSARTCIEGWYHLLADSRVEGALVVGKGVGILLPR